MIVVWKAKYIATGVACFAFTVILLSQTAKYSKTSYLHVDLSTSQEFQNTLRRLETVENFYLHVKDVLNDDSKNERIYRTVVHENKAIDPRSNSNQTSSKSFNLNSNKTKRLYDFKNPFWMEKTHDNENYSLLYRKEEGANHQTPLVTTSKCKVQYKLLVLITSLLSHFSRRQTIRNTYGNDESGHRWKTYFVLGRSGNKNNLNLLHDEIQTYGDIILADVYEDFYNLTAKVKSGFEWSIKYCQFQYLFKGDDDIFINMPRVFNHLDSENIPKTELYTGNVQFQAHVFRNGRYGVGINEFKRNVYPRYCSGGGFIVSHDVVSTMVRLFQSVPSISIDDAYIGMVALKGGIDPTHEGNFRFFENEQECVYRAESIVHHPVTSQKCMEKLFKGTT